MHIHEVSAWLTHHSRPHQQGWSLFLFIKPSFEFNVVCNFNLGIVLLATCSGCQCKMVWHAVDKACTLFMKCDL